MILELSTFIWHLVRIPIRIRPVLFVRLFTWDLIFSEKALFHRCLIRVWMVFEELGDTPLKFLLFISSFIISLPRYTAVSSFFGQLLEYLNCQQQLNCYNFSASLLNFSKFLIWLSNNWQVKRPCKVPRHIMSIFRRKLNVELGHMCLGWIDIKGHMKRKWS